MRYVLLHRDVEDGCWTAEVPSLPGCVSSGQTRDAAMLNATNAVETWISAAKDQGIPVPADLLAPELRVVM